MPRPRTITDQRLLDATARVIARSGPGFTLADVAAEAAVSVGTVAGRFGAKAGLLRALSEHFTAVVGTDMRAVAAAVDDPVDALRAVVVSTHSGLGDAESAGNHLGQLGVDLQDPVLRRLLGEHYAVMERVIAEACARAAPALPGMPDPGRAARALLALANGATIGWSVRPAGDLGVRLAEDVDAVLSGWAR